jgi:hypothetical protein
MIPWNAGLLAAALSMAPDEMRRHCDGFATAEMAA